MTAIAPDHEVRSDLHAFSAGCLSPHPGDLFSIAGQIDGLVLHSEVETREILGLPGKKIQKIPLRHQRDKFAMG